MELPLGEGHVSFDLPDCRVDVAVPPGGEGVDVGEAAERALGEPNGPRLARLTDPGDLVTVVVTDMTRETPDDVLLGALLRELERGGVAREQVTVVVGLGLHRPMTDAELEAMLGPGADLAENHDPDDCVEVGRVDGVRVEVNRRVAEADLVVSTGMVEPHQYAGFSGGAKTVAIGAGSESFIEYTHGPGMLAREGVRLGRIEDNPFREAVDRVGDRIGLDFCLNVTGGREGVLGVEAGEPRAVVASLADVAREALAVDVDTLAGPYDAVLCGVGAPKDATLYQTTRALTYVVLGARNPLREGGRVVIPAELGEGAGEGRGERRFYEWLSGADSPEGLYESMKRGYEPGAQRAFVVARALRDHPTYITDSHAAEVVEACLMHAQGSVPDAVRPGSDVLVVPDALHTLLV